MTSGIQVAFYFVFLPYFLNSLTLSLATVSFYFILFSVMGSVIVRSLLRFFPNRINMQGRILISAILQILGLLLLALMPTAKILVLTVMLMGAALGLHEFRYLEYYKEMIREDKQALAREILERAFASGAILGSVGYGVLFLFDNMRLSLLLFTLIMAVLVFAYPLVTLLYTPAPPVQPVSSDDPAGNAEQSPFAQYQQTPDYSQQPAQGNQEMPPTEEMYPQEYYTGDMPPYDAGQTYGQDPYGLDERKEGRHK